MGRGNMVFSDRKQQGVFPHQRSAQSLRGHRKHCTDNVQRQKGKPPWVWELPPRTGQGTWGGCRAQLDIYDARAGRNKADATLRARVFSWGALELNAATTERQFSRMRRVMCTAMGEAMGATRCIEEARRNSIEAALWKSPRGGSGTHGPISLMRHPLEQRRALNVKRGKVGEQGPRLTCLV